MSKILLISDNPLGSSVRGAEQMDYLIQQELKCDFLTCEEFNGKFNDSLFDKYIVSNFSSMSEAAKQFLLDKNKIFIAHDFIFTHSRNPGIFLNFEVPPESLCNVEFLKSFKKIYCQSEYQADIFRVNGFQDNVESWGGNIWDDRTINFCLERSTRIKNGRAAVIEGQLKGEQESSDLCKILHIPFDIIPKMDYLSFLDKLGEYSAYVFKVNYAPETFGRVLIEAKLMNTLSIVPGFCGALWEDLWNYNGEELAVKLHLKREEILNKLKQE